MAQQDESEVTRMGDAMTTWIVRFVFVALPAIALMVPLGILSYQDARALLIAIILIVSSIGLAMRSQQKIQEQDEKILGQERERFLTAFKHGASNAQSGNKKHPDRHHG